MTPYARSRRYDADVDTVVLVGCNTNGCVFETAAVGKNMGLEFVMPGNATACFHPILRTEAEVWNGWHFGQVCTTEEAIAPRSRTREEVKA